MEGECQQWIDKPCFNMCTREGVEGAASTPMIDNHPCMKASPRVSPPCSGIASTSVYVQAQKLCIIAFAILIVADGVDGIVVTNTGN